MSEGNGRVPDMRSFQRRLILRGRLTLRTGLRVGAGRDPLLEVSELPVMKTADGRPYIPGASFKGAWRAATEALLRGLPDHHAKNLACLSVPRPEKPSGTCLCQAQVTQLKAAPPKRWEEILDGRFAEVEEHIAGLSPEKARDETLRLLSCRTCRVFGAPWLAGKVLVKDLTLAPGWEGLVEPQVRDGVAIDRDKGSAADKRKFAYEVVPADTPFEVEIVVENPSDAELGLAWLGLRAFQQGRIPLGGARSRGLGWCILEIDWGRSQWLTSENLLASLFPEDPDQPVGVLEEESGSEQVKRWWRTFLQEIGVEGGADA
jgi:CRISPR-associated RAMP protein (TIGR02581 family)